MKQRLDNMSSAGLRTRMRAAALILFGGAAFAGALGVPYTNLQETKAQRGELTDARARLERLQRECADFQAKGGFSMLAELREEVAGELPSELSTIELRGLLALLAHASRMKLSTLSIGEFVEAGLVHIDDAIACCEVSLSGSGSVEALANLIELLSQLGYPVVVLDFRLTRSNSTSSIFKINATLGAFQSIPIPESSASDVSDVPDMVIPQ